MQARIDARFAKNYDRLVGEACCSWRVGAIWQVFLRERERERQSERERDVCTSGVRAIFLYNVIGFGASTSWTISLSQNFGFLFESFSFFKLQKFKNSKLPAYYEILEF